MKFFSLLLLFMLPLSLAAEDSGWFIGIEGGMSEARFTKDSANSGRVYSPQYGLKIGLQKENTRIYLGYNQTEDLGSDLESSETLYLALEGVSDGVKIAATSNAKLFVGVHLGAATAVINGSASAPMAYAEDPATTAYIAGFQTGFIFSLPADFEIELAYRHYLTYMKERPDFNSGTLYGGLNYRFYTF